jgi:dCMP deaminase
MESDDQRYMEMANDAARKSNCVRRGVGAVIVRNGEILATGWNGVSEVHRDCSEAGCPRCINGGTTGTGYEQCICIHAEQRAIAEAAARGVSTKNSVMYVNLRPCLQCLAITRAAGVRGIVFDEDWTYPEEFEQTYRALAGEFELFGRVGGPEFGEPSPAPSKILR